MSVELQTDISCSYYFHVYDVLTVQLGFSEQ